MSTTGEPPLPGGPAPSQSRNDDLEDNLQHLRAVVCDLLKTNQELREALKAAQSHTVTERGPR